MRPSRILGRMFVALRETLAAKGRMGLIMGTVGLITLLIVMLTGLTAGLGKQNTSALEALSPRSVVFEDNDDPSFSTSRISAETASHHPGAVPLGTAQTLVTRQNSEESASIALLGLPEGTRLPDDQVLGAEAIASAELGLEPGEKIEIGSTQISVGAIAEDLYFSHSPVIWVPLATWREAAHAEAYATALLLDSTEGLSLREAYRGLPAYASERGSLLMIVGFLYFISALITIAFLSVWTIQRTRDLAILKALGAPTSYLLRDALGQAALVLGVGVAVGGGGGFALGMAIKNVVPFELDWAMIVVPAGGVWLLGIAGAALATRSIAAVEPQLALGGHA